MPSYGITHEIEASLGTTTKTIFEQSPNSYDLTTKWQGHEYLHIFCHEGVSYSKNILQVQIQDVFENGRVGIFSYAVPSDWGANDSYQVACFTSACYPQVKDKDLYYNASIQRYRLQDFQVPVYYYGTVDSNGKLSAIFHHYYTYELLHIKNTSSKDIKFALSGYNAVQVWYKTRGAFKRSDVGKDDFVIESPATKPAITECDTFDIPAGYDDVVVSAYVPTGQKIRDARMVAKIDGETKLSSNTKSSNAELKIGHAYHMYAEWDGKELKFVDAFSDASISVSTLSLEFGEVKVGESKTLSFDITNNTSEQISIGDIWSEDTNFTVDWMAGTIGPRETQTVNVTFTPDRAYVANGAFTIGNEKESYTVTYTAEGVAAGSNAEYVDLGLPSGTLWATCNLGATKPEEYGLYYQWGDTQGYGSDTNDGKYFDWSTYKWCDGSRYTLTKYNTDKSYGIVDNMVTLMSDDDAARAALGSKWRMPSNVEWEELLNNCTLTWTTVNGVNGYKLQSKVPGYADSWIFLPAAGARSQDNLVYVGDNGYYYFSSIALYLPYGMSFLFFSSSSLGANMAVRSNGMSIRPVYAETEPSTVSVTTTDIDFGDVKVGTSVSKTFKITNTGSKATNVTISESYGIATSDFSGVATLAAGESKTITLTCSPNEIGSFNGVIDIIAGNWCQITYKGNAVESTGGYSYEYVDLGLSVKWATCNLGATKPEEYGLYYQWGDTQGYGSDPSDGKKFGWSTYKWCNGSYNSLTKYNTNSTYGTVDNKTVLDMEDDAARAALGGNWRMPTDAEWTELRENCTWTWTMNYNETCVAGRIVTSNKTGYTNKSIFLPAAGYRSPYGLSRARSYGYYWSSSLDTDCPVYAWDVIFYLEDVGRVYDDRYYGLPVRPVLE